MSIRGFDEDSTKRMLEEFYIGSLTNDARIVNFFEGRITKLDEQVKDVSKTLADVIQKPDSQAYSVKQLEHSLASLGSEVNTILKTLQILTSVTQSSLSNKGELERTNYVLRDDMMKKTRVLAENIAEQNRRIKRTEGKLRNSISDILSSVEQKMSEEDEVLLKRRFYPLIEIIRKDIIEDELNQRGQFRALLEQATEQYSEVNNRVMFLSDVIDKMRGYEAEVLSEEKLQEYVRQMRTEVESYSATLYMKISKELDNLTEGKFNSIEEIQQQYQSIIGILNGEIDEIDKEGTVKAFKPLIRELIDTELGERGRFADLLSQSIDKLSKETNEDIQNQFRHIVTTIVGEGSKQNQRMARQNVEIGLRKMSESDIDELLGRKIISIVDKGSNIGNALGALSDKVNNIVVFGNNAQKNTAQKFFDGLSFSIYYYKFTKDTLVRFVDDTLLPEELKKAEFDYIGEFEKIATEFEQTINEVSRNKPDKYRQYKKVQFYQITDNETMQTLDIYCFFRYYDGQKVYLFLNQEPSIFFKKELDAILSSGSPLEETVIYLQELIKNYAIPKVQVAVFNKDGFELPSEDDDSSVVSTKTGDKGLTLDEEEELSDVLDSIANYYPYNKQRKGLFGFFGRKDNIEYYHHLGLWYFWSIKTPSPKYLAIKMIKPFEDERSEQDFEAHVKDRIWFGLQKSKSIGEMQDWVDSFTQKDSGVLNSDGFIIRSIRFVSANWLALFTLFFTLYIGVFVWWLLIEPRAQLINEKQVMLEHKITTLQTELQLTKSKQYTALEQKIATLQAELQLTKAERYTEQPFILEAKNISDNFVDSIQSQDLNRLQNIGKSLQDSIIQITIIPHINSKFTDAKNELNKVAAHKLKEYLLQTMQINAKQIAVEMDETQFITESNLFAITIKSHIPN